jgi:hypothetical protein
MPDLSLRRLGTVLDFGQQLRLDPDALVCDPLCEGLRLPNEGLQALPQVGGRNLVESMIDLAGVDKVVSLASANVEPIPLRADPTRSRRWSGSPAARTSS